MQNVASAWLIVQLTHSSFQVGVLALAQFLPFTLFGLFAGTLVDRIEARRLVIGTQIVQMLLASALAAVALAGVVTPWMVFLAALAGLLAMRESDLFPVERRERPTILQGSREGLRWVWGDRNVRTVLIVVLVVSTFGFNLNVLLPLLASATLHAGPRTFGLVSAFFGLGALVG